MGLTPIQRHLVEKKTKGTTILSLDFFNERIFPVGDESHVTLPQVMAMFRETIQKENTH